VGRGYGGQPVFQYPTSLSGAAATPSTSHQYQGPGSSRAFSVIGGGSSLGEEGWVRSGQGQRGSCSKRHKLDVDEEDVSDEVEKSSAQSFVTARDEYVSVLGWRSCQVYHMKIKLFAVHKDLMYQLIAGGVKLASHSKSYLRFGCKVCTHT